MMTRRLYPLLFLLLALPAGAETKEVRKGFEFTRMLAHWANYAEPGYLAFIDETKPDATRLRLHFYFFRRRLGERRPVNRRHEDVVIHFLIKEIKCQTVFAHFQGSSNTIFG